MSAKTRHSGQINVARRYRVLLQCPGEYVRRVHFHGFAQSHKHVDGGLTLTPLDIVDVLTRDAGPGGQLLLRQSGREPGFLQLSA